MKRSFISLLILAFISLPFTGCVIYNRQAPDGSKVAARGFFMKVGQIDAHETATNGTTRGLTVKELTGDAAMAAAVAEGAAKGVAQGMK